MEWSTFYSETTTIFVWYIVKDTVLPKKKSSD